ncbi:MAG TPA: hypothetical protein DCX28_11445 [Enterobacteriaceae bacterium]|nr:hypothetical protein [Enterobacteriaceae bacterium]
MRLATTIYDYREEFHVKIFRIWMIVKYYGLNRNEKKQLSIEKAHLLDFILQNDSLLMSFSDALNKEDSESMVLYKTNLMYGENNNYRPSIAAISVLNNLGYIEIERINGEFYCTCTDKSLTFDSEITLLWESKLKKLKPVIAKSVNAINKKLSEANL